MVSRGENKRTGENGETRGADFCKAYWHVIRAHLLCDFGRIIRFYIGRSQTDRYL